MWKKLRRSRTLSVFSVLAFSVLALAVSGCVTRAQEAKLGNEEAKKVEGTMGLVDDPQLLRYVRTVGEKLVAVSKRPDDPWNFLIVDMPEPNAFALPGGHIYVTRGLLALVNSEDELAGVMGHEIGHVTARHTSKRIGAAVVMAPINIATGIAGFAVGIVSPALGGAVAGTGQLLTGGLVIQPFSREQENQADEIGQGLAAKAGYDPAGISYFLHTLDREVVLSTGKESSFHFMSSHPQTPERVKSTEDRAKRLERAPGQPVVSGRAGFFGKIEGIIVGEDPAQGIFEENVFQHPEFDLALTFPMGWETINTANAVGAMNPSKDALVAMQIAQSNATLDEFVAKAKEKDKSLTFERFDIRGLPAARTRSRGRGTFTEVTLIGYGGTVYSVVGHCKEANADAYMKTFDVTARSFRALRSSERKAIHESRLRVREARSGETPEKLTKRTASTWSTEQLAVANAVKTGEVLKAGQPMKVAISQPYTRRGD